MSVHRQLFVGILCALCATLAAATETITYNYDARGRLIAVGRTGTVNNNVNACYTYDRANNRINVASQCLSFSVNNASVTEGSSLVFTVSKAGMVSQSYSVNYATSNGTAAAGDYTAASGTLTFGATETSKTISVPTTNDTDRESTETVTLTLSGATGGAAITVPQGTGSILDNDTPQTFPAFSVNDVSVTEGGNLIFTISRTASEAGDFYNYNVSWSATEGTATWGGVDFGGSGVGSLTFGPSETTKTVTIPTTDDSIVESAETMYLNLSSATGGATIADPQGVGTINDNDVAAPPSFSINDVSGAEGPGATIAFTVTKTGATSSSYSVNYATADGSATSSGDYFATSGTLTFAAGEMSKSIIVNLRNNVGVEATEYFYLNLSGATGGAGISDSQGVGTIYDDDQPPCQRGDC